MGTEQFWVTDGNTIWQVCGATMYKQLISYMAQDKIDFILSSLKDNNILFILRLKDGLEQDSSMLFVKLLNIIEPIDLIALILCWHVAIGGWK